MSRRTIALSIGIGLGFVALVGVSGQTPGGSAEGRKLKNPVAANAASIAAGKTAYARNCRFCHGAEGKGDGPSKPKDSLPSDLTDATWDRGATDGEIFVIIRDGAGPKFDMKGYKGRIADPEIWNIVNFVRTLGPQAKK
jgi:mono/diheme cytochrome c family protein